MWFKQNLFVHRIHKLNKQTGTGNTKAMCAYLSVAYKWRYSHRHIHDGKMEFQIIVKRQQNKPIIVKSQGQQTKPIIVKSQRQQNQTKSVYM